MKNPLKRRPLLAALATAVVLLVVVLTVEPKPKDEIAQIDQPVAFFLIGDTHILANIQPAKLDDRSAALNAGLVDVLNKLAGTDIPQKAGGGKVVSPRGVIHAGDCIDTGNQAKAGIQETE